MNLIVARTSQESPMTGMLIDDADSSIGMREAFVANHGSTAGGSCRRRRCVARKGYWIMGKSKWPVLLIKSKSILIPFQTWVSPSPANEDLRWVAHPIN